MEPTSNALIAAAKDLNLRERAIALASSMGIPNAQYAVDSHLPMLVAAPVNNDGTSLASVFEYAQAEYEKKKDALIEPGKDMARVTDEHIRYALKSVLLDDAVIQE